MANIPINFRDATRSQAKASIVIQGLSGSGKSGAALLIANALADGDWSSVFCVDTENRSLDLFEGISTHLGGTFGVFKKIDLLGVNGFRPTTYLQCKQAAIKAHAKVVVLDSLTHMWQGAGGLLAIVSDRQENNPKLNKWNVWGIPEVVAEKNAIYDCIRDPEVHMIGTVRVKEKFDLIPGEAKLKSLGEQQMQMPDLKYEPDLLLDMVHSGTTIGRPPKVRVLKSRYAILEADVDYEINEEFLNQLKDYLSSGVDPGLLQEQQRLEYLNALKQLLDTSPSKRTMYFALKSDSEYKDVELDDMPLHVVRSFFSQITD